mmetsp:Transcript_2783/g.4520  ORF Transcript_2783/g.4520 Transcript_2783/m.4520 type:complete len:235 (+) Transcript_2783:253-957(+)
MQRQHHADSFGLGLPKGRRPGPCSCAWTREQHPAPLWHQTHHPSTVPPPPFTCDTRIHWSGRCEPIPHCHRDASAASDPSTRGPNGTAGVRPLSRTMWPITSAAAPRDVPQPLCAARARARPRHAFPVARAERPQEPRHTLPISPPLTVPLPRHRSAPLHGSHGSSQAHSNARLALHSCPRLPWHLKTHPRPPSRRAQGRIKFDRACTHLPAVMSSTAGRPEQEVVRARRAPPP